jgi:hypothetical protein
LINDAQRFRYVDHKSKYLSNDFILGNETVAGSHIPIDAIRRRKEQLKREIQVSYKQ